MREQDSLNVDPLSLCKVKICRDIPVGVDYKRLFAAYEHVGIVGEYRKVELDNREARIFISVYNLMIRRIKRV